MENIHHTKNLKPLLRFSGFQLLRGSSRTLKLAGRKEFTIPLEIVDKFCKREGQVLRYTIKEVLIVRRHSKLGSQRNLENL